MKETFINQYSVTYETYRRWAARPVGKTAIRNRRRWLRLRITVAGCSIVIIVTGIMLQDFFNILLGITMLGIALLRLFVTPDKILRKQYNLVLKSQNTDSWIRTITFGEEILCEDGNTTHRYSYGDVQKFLEDSDYFYLFYNEDMVLRVKKGCFAAGNDDAFREFGHEHFQGTNG